MPIDLHCLTVAEASSLIKTRALSPVDLAQTYFAPDCYRRLKEKVR
jgi:hypothetical protein